MDEFHSTHRSFFAYSGGTLGFLTFDFLYSATPKLFFAVSLLNEGECLRNQNRTAAVPPPLSLGGGDGGAPIRLMTAKKAFSSPSPSSTGFSHLFPPSLLSSPQQPTKGGYPPQSPSPFECGRKREFKGWNVPSFKRRILFLYLRVLKRKLTSYRM